jgi:hypothetical protein
MELGTFAESKVIGRGARGRQSVRRRLPPVRSVVSEISSPAGVWWSWSSIFTRSLTTKVGDHELGEHGRSSLRDRVSGQDAGPGRGMGRRDGTRCLIENSQGKLALTPTLSGSTELAEVHPKRASEGVGEVRSAKGHGAPGMGSSPGMKFGFLLVMGMLFQ